MCWLSEERLKAKKSYLSVEYVQNTTEKLIPAELQNQYKNHNNESLANLLLSLRAKKKDGLYMPCLQCYYNITRHAYEKPPRFGITNGWLRGKIPNSAIGGKINDRIRVFSNVYSYSVGAHKVINCQHIYFMKDPEHIGSSFKYVLQSGIAPDMYVMIYGRVISVQRDVIGSHIHL